MEPEVCPENKDDGNSGLLRSFAIYLAIFIFGFLAASFWGGAKDSVKGTANLAVNTAKETFSIPSEEALEFVPLKSSGVKSGVVQKPTIYKVRPSLPVVVEEDGLASKDATLTNSTASSPQIFASGSGFSVPSSTSTSGEPASASQAEILQNNTSQADAVKFIPLIYEIRITGGTGKSNEDYIKIFNPNPKAVDLSGWRLKKASKTGSESSIRVFPDGTIVGAGKVITWANVDYASVVGAELLSSQTIAANNSVGLFNKDGVLVDAVGWGEVAGGFVEGLAYPTSLEAGQVLLRKQAGGVLLDTQNNAQDFEIY